MIRRAIITGVCNGIGKELSLSLIKDGYEVIGLDKLENTNYIGENYYFYKCDVSDSKSINKIFSLIQKKFGYVNCLINIVGGTLHSKDIEQISDNDWDTTINFNLKTPFNCIRSALPMLKNGKEARIVNISAVAGRTYTFFGGVDFTAAKAGVIGLTRQCAFELAKFGITANCVAPGLTMTNRVSELWKSYSNESKLNILQHIPLGRPAAVTDQVNIIKFLCSEGSSYITGAVIDVNGGMFMG